MTPMTRALLTNYTETLSLCPGLTPATERWDGRQSQISQTRTPPYSHPCSVDFVTGGCPAQITAAHWSQTHSGPFQRLGGVVASRQSRAGQLIQPADPWICTQNNKSHSNCWNASGFVVGIPQGGVYDHRVVSNLQNIAILSPESGSTPSNWPRSRSMGLNAQERIKL